MRITKLLLIVLTIVLLLFTSCQKIEIDNTQSSGREEESLPDIYKSVDEFVINDVIDENEDLVKEETEEYRDTDGELPDDIISDVEYSMEFELLPTEPNYIVTIYGYNVRSYKLLTDEKNYYLATGINHITKMTIENKELGFSQELTFNETETPDNGSATYGLAINDYNFDGYNDISLWLCEGGSIHNVPTLFWLWDEETNRFLENNKLSSISWDAEVIIDKDNQELQVYSYEITYHFWDYYKWIGNEVVLKGTYSLIWELNEESGSVVAHHIVEEVVDGKLVIVEDYIEEVDD